MTAQSTSGPVGGTIDVDITGCPLEDFGGYVSYPQIKLVTGTGADARAAAEADPYDGNLWDGTGTYRITIPGWVDPDEPAIIIGACDHYVYNTAVEHEERMFTWNDIAVDVTPPAGAVPYVHATPNRTTLAGGQALGIEMSGCRGQYVDITISDGADMTVRELRRQRHVDFYGPTNQLDNGGRLDESGSGTVLIAMNDERRWWEPREPGSGGPLAPGDYHVEMSCEFGNSWEYAFAPPFVFHIEGERQSDDISIGRAPLAGTETVISGSSCSEGPVTLYFHEANISPDSTAHTVAAADGSWTSTYERRGTTNKWHVKVVADCGDPLASGFRYRGREFDSTSYPYLPITTISPPGAALTGSTVTVAIKGVCKSGPVTVQLLDSAAQVVVESAPITLDADRTGSGTFRAPARVGAYLVAGACDGETSYPEPYRVVAGSQTDPEPDTATPATPIPGTTSFTG